MTLPRLALVLPAIALFGTACALEATPNGPGGATQATGGKGATPQGGAGGLGSGATAGGPGQACPARACSAVFSAKTAFVPKTVPHHLQVELCEGTAPCRRAEATVGATPVSLLPANSTDLASFQDGILTVTAIPGQPGLPWPQSWVVKAIDADTGTVLDQRTFAVKAVNVPFALSPTDPCLADCVHYEVDPPPPVPQAQGGAGGLEHRSLCLQPDRPGLRPLTGVRGALQGSRGCACCVLGALSA